MSELQRRHQSIIEHHSYNEFNKSMEEFIDLFASLDYLIGGRNCSVFFSKGKTYNFDTQLLQSAKMTLLSIIKCCDFGSISDANTLIRKFRDDIFFYLYVLQVDNNRVILFDETRKDKIQEYNKQINFIVKWFNNSLSNFDFNRNIVPYLKTNTDIEEIINKDKLEDIWKRIFKNLNNGVHNNGVSYCAMNYRDHKYEDIENIFHDIVFKTDYITTIFMMLFILVKPHYIMSSDYIDCCDFGIEPPEDSQYWVAPFIQEFIDKHIGKHNLKYKLFIKDKVYMNID
ncbi:MAG: hypothetical protein PHN41_05855 [Bacteroidales bacterium]|nr:hypothetical protein [Bacteroidales bacterium]